MRGSERAREKGGVGETEREREERRERATKLKDEVGDDDICQQKEEDEEVVRHDPLGLCSLG